MTSPLPPVSLVGVTGAASASPSGAEGGGVAVAVIGGTAVVIVIVSEDPGVVVVVLVVAPGQSEMGQCNSGVSRVNEENSATTVADFLHHCY